MEGKLLSSRELVSLTAVAVNAGSRTPPSPPIVKGKAKANAQSAIPEEDEELSCSAAEGEEEEGAAEDVIQSEEEDASQT